MLQICPQRAHVSVAQKHVHEAPIYQVSGDDFDRGPIASAPPLGPLLARRHGDHPGKVYEIDTSGVEA